MRFLFISALLPAAQAFAPADVSGMGTPISKTTTGGPIIGRVDTAGIQRYFGIPTAVDVSGANRWTAPVARSWSTAIQTTLERPCASNRGGSEGLVGQEDCVSVDVMTTTTATAEPIVFWTHGGGFTREDLPFEHMTHAYYQKDFTPHPAIHLSNGGKLVTVLNHYRLSTLGWMAHLALNAEGTYGGSGNYGLMDSIHNLRWVRDNAATFGGDNTRVTIMGESAGGAHTVMILASPESVGLIHNAIAESPYISWQPATYSMTARYAVNTMLANVSGCGPIGTGQSGAAGAAELACLRSTAFSAINDLSIYGAMGNYDAVFGQGSGYAFLYNSIECWPVVDNYMLTRPPLASWAAGINANVHVIIGHNSDEYTTFYANASVDYNVQPYLMVDQGWNLAMGPVGNFALDETATAAQIFAAVAQASVTRLGAPLDALYGAPAPIGGYPNNVQKASDAWFTAGVTTVVNALNAQPTRTAGTVFRFMYANDIAASVADYAPTFGACHGCELDYVLGLYELSTQYFFVDAGLPVPYTAAEIAMGQAMKKYWVHMMYYGFPTRDLPGSHPRLPRWHPDGFNGQSHTMVFKATFDGGAAMDPCLRVIPCRTETSGGPGGFRARITGFWKSEANYASLPDGVCTRSDSGLTIDRSTCPAFPTASCAGWCNVHTCNMNGCGDCAACTSHDEGQTCEPWCNTHTCGMSHCFGCGHTTCPHPGTHCLDWCNAHTCGDNMCAGCAACAARRV